MAASDRTKKLKKNKWLFFSLDTLFWVGTALFAIIATIIRFTNGGDTADSSVLDLLSDSAKEALIGIATTCGVGIVMTIFLKEKMRTTLWLASVVMISILYGDIGLYITLGLWFIEDVIFHNLFEYYSKKVLINKEIDIRS